jgi:hypothetical protein
MVKCGRWGFCRPNRVLYPIYARPKLKPVVYYYNNQLFSATNESTYFLCTNWDFLLAGPGNKNPMFDDLIVIIDESYGPAIGKI